MDRFGAVRKMSYGIAHEHWGLLLREVRLGKVIPALQEGREDAET